MKLPSNRLLYVVSLAFAGGVVLNIMGTVSPSSPWDPKEVGIRSKFKTLLKLGCEGVGRTRAVSGALRRLIVC